MMSSNPIDPWKRLAGAGEGDGLLEVPSIESGVSSGYGQVRYAIGPNNEPRLLVPVGDAHDVPRLSSTPKLGLMVSRFNTGGKWIHYIDLMGRDRALDTVFADMSEEILRRISEGNPPGSAVSGTIEDFRNLLREASAKEACDNAILGLIGELHVLKMLCGISPYAVSSWVAPYEARHDFRSHLSALEVKSSGRSDARKVSIHGMEQLCPPAGGSIVLVHCRFERVAGGMTVKSLCRDIIEAGGSETELTKGLASMDCDSPDSEAWNRISFSLQGMSSYRVEKGFPRIVGIDYPGGSFPEGIVSLEYEIDLSHASRFQMPEAEFRSFLEGFSS